jgi:microcystin-dependent protein
MAEPFVGEIRLFGFQFAPLNWAMCNGQLMAISQNEMLFALLGTTYGGDGIQTFQLPNLQGRAALSFGQGPGLSNYNLGQPGGEENHTLLVSEIPAHTHTVGCKSTPDTSTTPTSPVSNFWAKENNGDAPYRTTASGLANMHPSAIANVGGSLPHNNMQPFLVVNFCIALFGIFPSRN